MQHPMHDMALDHLAEKHNVGKNHLEFVSEWDTGFKDIMLLMFNIMDPCHPAYRSSVVYPIDPWGKEVN